MLERLRFCILLYSSEEDRHFCFSSQYLITLKLQTLTLTSKEASHFSVTSVVLTWLVWGLLCTGVVRGIAIALDRTGEHYLGYPSKNLSFPEFHLYAPDVVTSLGFCLLVSQTSRTEDLLSDLKLYLVHWDCITPSGKKNKYIEFSSAGPFFQVFTLLQNM